MMIRLFRQFLQFSFILMPFVCQARWATVDDASIEFILFNQSIVVNSDGTSEEVLERKIKILNENGKEYANYQLTYKPQQSDIQILEATTINGSEHTPVDASMIEDKPVSSSPHGFDDMNQIVIPFSKVKVGSILHIKTRNKRHTIPLTGWYRNVFVFGQGGLWSHGKVELKSALPIELQINDPEELLSVNKDSQGFQIELKRPVIKEVVDEDGVMMSNDYLCWASASTISDENEFIHGIAKLYQERLASPLPDMYKEIVKKAKSETSLIDKLNMVTSQLADKIRYMGDWRTAKGSWVPRDPQLVASMQMGDCKDYSLATHLILKELGIKSSLALVHRGQMNIPGPNQIDKMYYLNHVILKVESANKTYFIDPTNISSMADGIFPDIADRDVYIVDIDNPHRERIPAITASHAQVKKAENWDLRDPNLFRVKGELTLTGERAASMTGYGLFTSKDALEHEFASIIGDVRRMKDKKLEWPSLKTRVVSDIHVRYDLSYKHMEELTSAGNAISIGCSNIFDYLMTSDDHVSDKFIGYPIINQYHFRAAHIKPVVQRDLDVHVDTQWFAFDRSYQYEANGFGVIDRLEIKKSWISNADLKSKEYREAMNKLIKYVINKPTVVYHR